MDSRLAGHRQFYAFLGCGLLVLEIKLGLTFHRRRHEHQLQVGVTRLDRRFLDPDAAGDNEQPVVILCQGAAIGTRKKLPGRIEQSRSFSTAAANGKRNSPPPPTSEQRTSPPINSINPTDIGMSLTGSR
jgi:hypothetical protein